MTGRSSSSARACAYTASSSSSSFVPIRHARFAVQWPFDTVGEPHVGAIVDAHPIVLVQHVLVREGTGMAGNAWVLDVAVEVETPLTKEAGNTHNPSHCEPRGGDPAEYAYALI
jgi:hypothetical protein